jgi:hypothetical protein
MIIMGKSQIPKQFCKQILELDEAFRFAGIIDKFGKILMAEHRKSSSPLLSKQEAMLSFTQSAIRMGSRKTLQPKLGKLIYTFSWYEKVKRATIPLNNSSVLLLSFDVEAPHDDMILNKVIPLAKKHGLLKD